MTTANASVAIDADALARLRELRGRAVGWADSAPAGPKDAKEAYYIVYSLTTPEFDWLDEPEQEDGRNGKG